MSDLAAFSFLTEGFFGHLSYILLIISSLMRRMLFLRLFVMGSAVAGIIFDYFMIGNVVGAFWQVLLLIVNIVQITLLWTRDWRARFSDEERIFVDRWLKAGSPGTRRALLDQGAWETIEAGVDITREGQRPTHLTYLAEGRASLSSAGQVFGEITSGHFIGEMSLMGEGKASADVQSATQTRIWRIDREKLEKMRRSRPDLYGLIEVAIALDLREKVLASNPTNASAQHPLDA